MNFSSSVCLLDSSNQLLRFLRRKLNTGLTLLARVGPAEADPRKEFKRHTVLMALGLRAVLEISVDCVRDILNRPHTQADHSLPDRVDRPSEELAPGSFYCLLSPRVLDDAKNMTNGKAGHIRNPRRSVPGQMKYDHIVVASVPVDKWIVAWR